MFFFATYGERKTPEFVIVWLLSSNATVATKNICDVHKRHETFINGKEGFLHED